ncbi:hypothetical protein N9X87_00425 [bacterium]|nr:hypothetical protein [bacterium]
MKCAMCLRRIPDEKPVHYAAELFFCDIGCILAFVKFQGTKIANLEREKRSLKREISRMDDERIDRTRENSRLRYAH